MGRPAGQATTPRNHGIVGRAERRSQLGRILYDVIDDCSRFVIMGGDAAAGKTTKRASENGPLVVIMEDIHWADESTRHVLRFLARALTGASVMIITTYRSDELTRRRTARGGAAGRGLGAASSVAERFTTD